MESNKNLKSKNNKYNNKNKKNKRDIDKLLDKKIILIQAWVRGYLARKFIRI